MHNWQVWFLLYDYSPYNVVANKLKIVVLVMLLMHAEYFKEEYVLALVNNTTWPVIAG